jgi:protein-S-isoprenylcysteine O-methyltransferase Ste14
MSARPASPDARWRPERGAPAAHERGPSVIARVIAGLAASAALYAAVFIGPAWLLTGDPFWLRGWLVVVAMVWMQAAAALWLAIADPDLLEERLSVRPERADDRLAVAFMSVCMGAWAVTIPLDVFRLHLLPPVVPETGLWGGATLFGLGWILLFWTMAANTFAAATVKIQRDRGQHLVDTGPYAHIRHPMYASAVVILAGIALMMGSMAMAIAAVPMVLLGLLPRILTEERVLKQGLPGYESYMSRVRWRILPGFF